MSLVYLISLAYDVPVRLIRLPASFDPGRYDIEAKSDRPVTREAMLRMLQTLLEERFRMAPRRETKQLDVLALVIAKGGPKIRENEDGADLEIRKVAAGKTSYKNMPLGVFANV